MTQPLFSVITPSYNQAHFIRETIESVLAQGIDDFEHIVMDGGSTDNTVKVLKEYPHLKWVSEKDKGQSDALNKGFAMSTGRIIAWINSDDFYAPEAFRIAAEFFEQHPESYILNGNCVYVDEESRVIRRAPPTLNRRDLLKPWKKDTSVFQPGTFFRREVIDKIGGIDVSIRYAMDYDFFLRASGHFKIHHINKDLGCFRVYGENKSGEGLWPFWQEIRPILLRYYRRYKPAEARWATVMLYLNEARIWAYDAIDLYESDGENSRMRHQKAWRLFGRAFLRNPFFFMNPFIMAFVLRRIIGKSLFEKLRAKIAGPRSLAGPSSFGYKK